MELKEGSNWKRRGAGGDAEEEDESEPCEEVKETTSSEGPTAFSLLRRRSTEPYGERRTGMEGEGREDGEQWEGGQSRASRSSGASSVTRRPEG